MAVSKATIKTALLSLYSTSESSPMSKEDFADGMADIVRNAILSADVSTNVSVISVSGVTTGPGVSGPGTGTGTGGLT